MTNRELDRQIARIERQTLMRSVLTFPINASALVVFVALALFAALVGEFVVASLILIIVACFVSLSIGSGVQKHNRAKRTRFWNAVRKRGFSGEKLTGDTKLLVDKIVAIQTATPDSEILTTRQAVKLMLAYQRPARQLQTINARLAKLNATRESLSQKTQQLQALGENHAAGLQSLERTRADFDALQKVAREVQSSCERLEAILDAARVTAVTRQLHRELDQLSAAATPEGNAAFDAESNDAIERQIGHEIETYLRLERETEEQLR